MRPKVVDWRITSKCHRTCPFCYGPESSDMATSELLKCIDILAANDIKVIGITGGEPLLKKGIQNIFQYIHERKIKICLSTNADLYYQYRDSILSYVSVIGLPLEGSISQIHNSLRGQNSFESVYQAFLDIIENSNIMLRIGSVVTKLNIEDLPNIENILSQYKERIAYWKLYELVIYENRKRQSINFLNSIYVKTKDFPKLGEFLGNNKVVFDPVEERCRSYFHINPNGDVTIPIVNRGKTSDLFLGNMIKTDFDTIVANWCKQVNYNKYIAPRRCAFRFVSSLDL